MSEQLLTIYGINPVFEALNSPRPPRRVFILKHKHNERLEALAERTRQDDIPLHRTDKLPEVSPRDVHQGVCAQIDDPVRKLPPIDQLAPRLVIFDGLQDPHNFGAALRVCDAFGFPQVIFHTGNSSGLTPAAVKVSAGAAFHLDIFASNLNSAIRRLADHGYTIMALDMGGDDDIYTCPLDEPFCLVIGAEDRGVRFAIRRLCDHVLRIPMHGKVDSLNVSCALSAALSDFARRHNSPAA